MLVPTISLRRLIERFWRKTLITWSLVLLEGLSLVLVPMVIGWAVDDLMEQNLEGVYQLAALCVFLLIAGAGRRFYDTRAYAAIYRTVANDLVEEERRKDTGLSKISARTNLFREFVEFLEDSIPGILLQVVNLAGTLVIIFTIDLRVFAACLFSIAVTTAIYKFSAKRIYTLNGGGNDELERQVDLLATGDNSTIQTHFRDLMEWRIKLSDLETLNFSLIWIVLSGVMVFTVVSVTSSGNANFGEIVSTVMYVFGFIESTMAFPLYYQQVVRLQEIAERLASPVEESE